MKQEEIKKILLDSIKFSTNYPINEDMINNISNWIASGSNTITQVSLVGILNTAIDKVHNELVKK